MAFFISGKCVHCQAPLNLREKAAIGLASPRPGAREKPNRCKTCQLKAQKALKQFAHGFRLACEDAIITSDEWQYLWTQLQPSGVTHAEALAFIRQDALQFLDTLIEMTFEDGVVTPEEEVYFRRMISTLGIKRKDMGAIRDKWENAKTKSAVQLGVE